jgi:transposase-like protein
MEQEGIKAVQETRVSQGINGVSADLEVLERPKYRRYTAQYKLKIVKLAEQCKKPGGIGALLRREGLYWSMLSNWRRQRDKGKLFKQGIHDNVDDAQRGFLLHENDRLRKENDRLSKRLKQAETIIEIQKKVSGMLGVSLPMQRDGTEE